MTIKKLSQETINQISAGEVVEGPSDVLKELIENAIDARANGITITIKSAGIDLIRIQDNGCGMTAEDLSLCLERHTTSKLTDINDLYSINSFGFRGEALSSISAISKVVIISNTDRTGKGWILDNSKITACTSQKGTTITISDLFYNTPARKKFLKSKTIEFSKLYDVFLAFAISNPSIRFSFYSESKNLVFPITSAQERYIQIFKNDFLIKTKEINVSTSFSKIIGVVSAPKNPFYFPINFIFINKRWVLSSQISKVIFDSYKDYLMIQQKPFFILFIDFDTNTIDINVHPKKRTIKLLNESIFLAELKVALTQAILGDTDTIPTQKHIFNDDLEQRTPSKQAPIFSSLPTANSLLRSPSSNFNYFETVLDTNQLFLAGHHITKVFGQIHATYIVCETADGFLLVDQHAASERINLEKNRVKYTSFEKQALITTIKVDFLSSEQIDFLKYHKSLFSEIGFDFYFLESVLMITTTPAFLNIIFDKSLLLDIISEMNQALDKLNFSNAKDTVIKMMSCKQSVKANDLLTIQQQIDLIRALDDCKDKLICAHGRPTIIYYKTRDLEKMFKRVV